MNKPLLWKLCLATMFLLIVVAYSPLVIPAGVESPNLFHLPRTIWAGLLVYVLMVLVTVAATRVHPELSRDTADSSAGDTTPEQRP